MEADLWQESKIQQEFKLRQEAKRRQEAELQRPDAKTMEEGEGYEESCTVQLGATMTTMTMPFPTQSLRQRRRCPIRSRSLGMQACLQD